MNSLTVSLDTLSFPSMFKLLNLEHRPQSFYTWPGRHCMPRSLIEEAETHILV